MDRTEVSLTVDTSAVPAIASRVQTSATQRQAVGHRCRFYILAAGDFGGRYRSQRPSCIHHLALLPFTRDSLVWAWRLAALPATSQQTTIVSPVVDRCALVT
jgi:hypothetical protein